jgi:hypothetical protein
MKFSNSVSARRNRIEAIARDPMSHRNDVATLGTSATARPMRAVMLAATLGIAACSSGGSSVPVQSPAISERPVSLASGYKRTKWASNVSVTYPTECTMTIITNGLPNHAMDAYYLEPAGRGVTGVASLPKSGTPLAVVPPSATAKTTIMSFNTCPTKAIQTTSTRGGAIGLMISGPALFNAAEGDPTISALTDNVTYTFTDSGGAQRKASFLDSCNAHSTPIGGRNGGTYHYHGLPGCVTAQVDTTGGPSHIIGVAADGFPIYGDKDIKGNAVTAAQLDECNGITSATPEFPDGVYHYVLPAGETGFQSSLRCYGGVVTRRQMAAMQSLGMCVTSQTVLAELQVLPGVGTNRRGSAISSSLALPGIGG